MKKKVTIITIISLIICVIVSGSSALFLSFVYIPNSRKEFYTQTSKNIDPVEGSLKTVEEDIKNFFNADLTDEGVTADELKKIADSSLSNTSDLREKNSEAKSKTNSNYFVKPDEEELNAIYNDIDSFVSDINEYYEYANSVYPSFKAIEGHIVIPDPTEYETPDLYRMAIEKVRVQIEKDLSDFKSVEVVESVKEQHEIITKYIEMMITYFKDIENGLRIIQEGIDKNDEEMALRGQSALLTADSDYTSGSEDYHKKMGDYDKKHREELQNRVNDLQKRIDDYQSKSK